MTSSEADHLFRGLGQYYTAHKMHHGFCGTRVKNNVIGLINISLLRSQKCTIACMWLEQAKPIILLTWSILHRSQNAPERAWILGKTNHFTH